MCALQASSRSESGASSGRACPVRLPRGVRGRRCSCAARMGPVISRMLRVSRDCTGHSDARDPRA